MFSRALNLCQTVIYFFVALFPALGVSAVACVVFSTQIGKEPSYDYGQLWYEEIPVPTIIFASLVSRALG
jgi:hypothetical protein